MPTIQVRAQISGEALVEAVEQLDTAELDQLAMYVRELRARRRAPGLPRGESDLLLTAGEMMSAGDQARLNELFARRRAETLTDDEQRELLELTERDEQMNARRIAALGQLAQLRGVSLPEVMRQLGLQPPSVL